MCLAKIKSKQKVRCHLCTEEKTFSRNDALTRHMRVVHPDVDFPGKTRRGRDNEGAAANNVSRSNQPGPHKRERINPSTGKPCNTVFSRSYDLTRHEDTIHSNRKQSDSDENPEIP